MIMYLSIGILITVSWIISLNTNYSLTNLENKNIIIKKLLTIFSIAILVLINYLRGINVGTDYTLYKTLYVNRTYKLFFDYFFIKIFDLAVELNNFRLITLFVIVIYLIYIFKTFNKKSNSLFTSIVLFLLTYNYFLSFNIMRQVVAASIVFYASYFLEEETRKGMLKFIGLTMIAFLFHKSAILCLVIIFIKKINLSSKIVVLSSVFISISYSIDIIRIKLESIILMLPYYSQKYMNNLDFFFSINKEKGILQFIPVLVQLIFMNMYIIKFGKSYKFNKITVNSYFVFLLLYSFSGIEAVDRFQGYFSLYAILFYDLLIYDLWVGKKGKITNVQILYIILMVTIVMFWLLYYILRVIQGTSGITPYKIWE